MADYDGDTDKRTPECIRDGVTRCDNMKETGGGFEGERYKCTICNAHYYLDYDDMR